MSICAYRVNLIVNITTLILGVASSLFSIGLCLGLFVNPWGFLLSAFVVLNLLQASYTGFCPLSIILSKLGWLDERGMVRWGGRRP